MVAVAHSPLAVGSELLKQPATPLSITSRTSSRRLSTSEEIVANIMQSLNITTAHRSPAINAHQPTRVLSSGVKQPTVSTAFSQSKPIQINSSLDLQSVAKELTDSSDTRNKQPTIEILKPSTCTGSSTYLKETALLANQVLTGLQARVAPVPIEHCTGGVYYLRTKNRRLTGVFKPCDEEAYAPNNPKKFHKPEKSSGLSGIRKGISAGDAAVREVAAYLLDHQHFARVPVTMLASVYHTDFHFQASGTHHCKTGALQAYVAHRDTADDVGAGMFNVADVQAIAILDIRLANQDRHGGNMLVIEPAQVVTQPSTAVMTKSLAGKKASLIPIDHGACLPRISALSETSFMWLLWPQAKQPFSTAAREYIRTLDADNDLKLLENNLPADYQLEREAMLTLHVCTALLKFCTLDHQMTAYDIGMIMCRQGTIAQQEMNPSVLETLVASSLRDPVVLKNESTLKLQSVQKMATISSAKTSPSPDKAWTNYVTTFMTVFRRELVAHLATK